MKKPKAYWHKYHDQLVGFSRNIQGRIYDIELSKPEIEVPTRLKLLKEIKGKLPAELSKAHEAAEKALRAYAQAKSPISIKKKHEASSKAWTIYIKILSEHMPKILKLHAKECPDCPWNGRTIFPQRKCK